MFGETLMLIRHMIARPRRWLILLALLAALPLPSRAAARPVELFWGCSPTGDTWFVEELAVAPRTIAPGVLVEPLAPNEPGSAEFLARLSNTTDTPLYLVETPFYINNRDFYVPAAPISLTAPLLVRQRIVAENVAFWAAGANRSAPEWLSESQTDSFIYVNRNYPEQILPGYQSLQRYGDDRPADVAIPQPVTYTLSVIYGRELFAIPVTQSYRLDPDYDPNQERTEQAKCDSWGKNITTMIEGPITLLTTAADLVHGCFRMLLLILLTVILFALVRMVRRYWWGL
jgi:hypothetical protein